MPECAKKSSIKRSPVHDHWPSCRHRRAYRDGIINEQEKRERWGEGRGGGGQGERGSNVSASRERMNRPTFSPLHTLPYTQAPCRCRCSAGNVQAGGRRQAAGGQLSCHHRRERSQKAFTNQYSSPSSQAAYSHPVTWTHKKFAMSISIGGACQYIYQYIYQYAQHQQHWRWVKDCKVGEGLQSVQSVQSA